MSEPQIPTPADLRASKRRDADKGHEERRRDLRKACVEALTTTGPGATVETEGSEAALAEVAVLEDHGWKVDVAPIGGRRIRLTITEPK